MEIIPAIDIIGGKCVRLNQGRFSSKKVYSVDPLKIAKSFQGAGIKRLHLVDLEGAKEGKIKNWETVKKIVRNTSLLVEFGGGIRNEADIKRLLNLGVDKVILGSLMLKDPGKTKKLFKKFKEKIIAAIDVKKNKIYYKGWLKKSSKSLYSFLRNLDKAGVKTIICTDIGRDGTMKGPNLFLYRKLVKDFPGANIIASGGVRNKDDFKKLSKIGVSGVILGKAIYEKKIKIRDLKNHENRRNCQEN